MSFHYREADRVIAFANQKGGVAKTTSCLNIGAALAAKGYQVLLVDLDAQGSLTRAAGYRQITKEEPTIYEVLTDKASIDDAIKTDKPYSLLPSDIRFSSAEVELLSVPGRDTLLKDALETQAPYFDYVLIDCPPSLSIITLMALAAASEVIIPIQAQYMALDGTVQLLDTIELVRKRLNKGLKVGGVFITMYNSRQNLDQTVIDEVRKAFPDELFKTIIDKNIKLAEAPAYGKDIFEYAPTSAAAIRYDALTDEIIKRGQDNGKAK